MTHSVETVHLTAKCPACGTLNELVADSTTEHREISCSHCGTKLGEIAQLVAAGSDKDRHTRDAL